MLKSIISSTLRKSGLLFFTDKLRFYFQKFKNKTKNNTFRQKNPSTKLPPDYLIYESFRLDYNKYYNGGKDTAKWLISLFLKYTELKNSNVLDWGCGPARIVRHFPDLLSSSNRIFGTDYNKDSIDWCKKNIDNVEFNNNQLKAELPYKDNFMDIIYGISIFTHLSEKAHFEWTKELLRVLKPNGIMLLSLQGDNFKIKLTQEELNNFNQGKLVVRGKVKEGHRTYSAFHPAPFVLELFHSAEIIEHIVEEPSNESAIPQDIWIIKKK